MSSKAKQRRQAARAANSTPAGSSSSAPDSNTAPSSNTGPPSDSDASSSSSEELDRWAAPVGAVAGTGGDVLLHSVYLGLAGRDLLEGATLKLVQGHRYGLVGVNGVGKSTLLRAIARRQLAGFPAHLRIVHVEQDDAATPPPDSTPVDWLVASDTELAALRREEAGLLKRADGADAARLAEIFAELAVRDADTAADRSRTLLSKVLVFSDAMLSRPASTLSGGWRMRVLLARALFLQADVLLLDEPTTHLDLPGIMWLQSFLRQHTSECVVVLVSHDRALLNAVATDIILFAKQQLKYYAGNYDAFEQAKAERLAKQRHLYDWQVRNEEHYKDSIDRALAHARATGDDKVLGQVASRRKKLERFGAEKRDDGRRWRVATRRKDGSFDLLRQRVEEPEEERAVVFEFGDPPELLVHGPTLQLQDVTLGYPGQPAVLTHVSLDVPAHGARIALVGANGAGKSTLMGALAGTIAPRAGTVVRHHSVRLGVFAQHDVNKLDPGDTPVSHLQRCFGSSMSALDARQALGGFGLSGPVALQTIRTLSGGQKTRVVLAALALACPHVLLLDEPSHHLDLASVQALIEALRAFKGSIVLVAHDQHLIRSVADTVYRVGRGTVTLCESLDAYLEQLQSVRKP